MQYITTGIISTDKSANIHDPYTTAFAKHAGVLLI